MKPLHELKAGETTSIGDKIYGRCVDCLKVIRLNRFFFGSMHLCVDDVEPPRKYKGAFLSNFAEKDREAYEQWVREHRVE